MVIDSQAAVELAMFPVFRRNWCLLNIATWSDNDGRTDVLLSHVKVHTNISVSRLDTGITNERQPTHHFSCLVRTE